MLARSRFVVAAMSVVASRPLAFGSCKPVMSVPRVGKMLPRDLQTDIQLEPIFVARSCEDGLDFGPSTGNRCISQLTRRGFKVLRTGEKIFDELRAQWAEQIGTDKLELVGAVLIERLKSIPGWLHRPGLVGPGTRGINEGASPITQVLTDADQKILRSCAGANEE